MGDKVHFKIDGERICKTCRLPESQHHKFNPIEVPIGCKCNPFDWVGTYPIPSQCNNFTIDPSFDVDLCKYCQHPKECHEKQ